MIDFEPRGGIFDVDDTLLDNRVDPTGLTLHEVSRLEAVHDVGRRHGIRALMEFTQADNLEAFLTAPVHTVDAAVWNALRMAGVERDDVMDESLPLVREIVERKNELHADILRNRGKEVAGSTSFVHRFAALPTVESRIAIASTAIRRDIGIYFEMVGLDRLIDTTNIVTKEDISHPKPHPEAFDRAFRTLGLAESERSAVCAFEDDPRGIMAAKAAGLYVCAITTRYSADELRSSEVAPDFVGDDYASIARHFGVREQG